MHGGLDITITDEASSTVIQVGAPVSARMCDVGCVFDKLGVDVISCTTMPGNSKCDMTLVVVDRCENQPLDDALKQSVTEGLQNVLRAHTQRSQQNSPSVSAQESPEQDSPAHSSFVAGHHSVAGVTQSAGSPHAQDTSGSRITAVDACRADSASESISMSKSPSLQLIADGAPAVEVCQQACSSRGRSPTSDQLDQLGYVTASEQRAGAPAACERTLPQQGQHQPTVRFNPECVVCIPSTAGSGVQHRAGTGRPAKPALKIDIPSDVESSSRWNDDSNNSSTRNTDQASSSTTGRNTGQEVDPPSEQLHAQDLARRLVELGMVRQGAEVVGEDASSSDGDGSDDDADADAGAGADADTLPSICRHTGGSGSFAAASASGPKWQKVATKSCGDLLLLAGQQQLLCAQRASDTGVQAEARRDGQLDCFGTNLGTCNVGLEPPQGDSSLGSTDQDQSNRRVPSPSTVVSQDSLGAGSSSGRGRRPPPRTPSRIILSPAALDGSGEPAGQPKLYISIPKSAGPDERRVKRTAGNSSGQSVGATPRLPFAPASGTPLLTPVCTSVRTGQTLKQLSNNLVSQKAASYSPTAAAAAVAAANMPYNVAVAAAQLLSNNSSSNTRETAAAVVAAAAEKSDSSTPLPSPMHLPCAAPAAPARQMDGDGAEFGSPKGPRSSPCFQHPPPTPVHPAVAAAAAAAITAAADAAASHAKLQHMHADSDDMEDDSLQLVLPAMASPANSMQPPCSQGETAPALAPDALAGATVGVTGAIFEACEDQAPSSEGGSSSEEWWCGELTGLAVRDIMTGPVRTVSADADMLQARQLMMQHNLPGMLVDAGADQTPGLLTRGDFFKASSLRRKGSRKRHQKASVRDFMSPVLVVDADMSIESCAQAMQEAEVRYAAVRDPAATAAAAEAGAEGGLSAYVGLVSDGAIYRCLGLYPDDAGAGEELLLEEGLLGLPHALRLHSGLDSSFDSSAGTDTPLSTRSRVATPLLENSKGDVSRQQQPDPQELQQSRSTDIGVPAQQSRQQSLVKMSELMTLREGVAAAGSSATYSVCSARSGPGAAADRQKSAAGTPSHDALGMGSSSFALVATGSDSSAAAPDTGVGFGSEGGLPDALARYKSAAALWEVDINDLEMTKRIGEGSFGEVMLANYRGTKVAVKRLRVLDLDDVKAPIEQYGADGGSSSTQGSSEGGKRAMGASQAAFRQFFEREIAILASIRHPNVVNFIGACHKPGQRCLVTEYCARGSLDQVLHKSGLTLDLTKRLEFALDIARGMACLHAQRPIIIHRDLKTANLLVSARFEVKVADFGLSRIKDASHLQVSRAGLEGTIEYCAPEVLRGEPYTERCDVYSFGVVLWELLLRQRPYSDAEVPVFLLMVNIGNGTLSLPEVPVEAATPGLVELLTHCLAFSAADRPEFREVLATLEAEYRALRANKQPPRTQQQQQQQLHAAAVLRCDSASSLSVTQRQSPRIIVDSPDPGSTPHAQSPASTQAPCSQMPAALTPAAGASYSSARAAQDGVGDHDAYRQQLQQAWQQGHQQQPTRHRLSQHDGGVTPVFPGGCSTPVYAYQQVPRPAAPPTVQQQPQHQGYMQSVDQQQVFSVPLPQLQMHGAQQVFVTPACSSPRQHHSQHLAVPQLRVMSAFAAVNAGPLQQQQLQSQHYTPHLQQQPAGQGGGFGGGSVAAGGSHVKPPRHKPQISRARSMPAPVNWDLLQADGEEEQSPQGFDEVQEEPGATDVLLFAEDSFGGVSNCSMQGYSPCPSGQLCVLVEPASSTYGSSSAAGMAPYTQQHQQLMVAPAGQQVAVQQVPMQAVLIQQPGGQLQQAYIQQQQHVLASSPQVLPTLQHQQQQPQHAVRILHRALGTPSPTPAVLGRPGTPLSSSPSPAINLAIMAAAGAAAAAARREGSASGAASPRSYASGAMSAQATGHNSRSSSHGGSQEMPPLHLLQLGDLQGSVPPSPRQAPGGADRGMSEDSGAGPPASLHVNHSSSAAGHQHVFGYSQPALAPTTVLVNPGASSIVTPVLLQRLDSLHLSGSSCCSPRCLQRSSSPGLQAVEQVGQYVGPCMSGGGAGPGSASGPSSPCCHSPQGVATFTGHLAPAGTAAVHHLHRPGSSRLAIQGSYELPFATQAAEQHQAHQPTKWQWGHRHLGRLLVHM